MFTLSEFYKQGINLAKHAIFGKSVLPTFMLYVCYDCNSRCKVCQMWKAKKNYLSVETIHKIINSPLLRKSDIGLEGGEFIMHPQHEEILALFSKRGSFKLLSNGLMSERLLKCVQRFNIPEVLISLDGGPETYLRVRGVDGYARVRESILSLRGYTKVSVVFTFNPWNNVSDFREIKEFCGKYSLNFKVGIFGNPPLLEIQQPQQEILGMENPGMAFPESDYLTLYNGWLRGKVRLPCLSIRFRSVVWPDGSVPLCQSKNIMLGNIYHQTIDEIWQAPRTKSLWRQYQSCNDCWGAFHRIYDVALLKILEKFLPKSAIKKLLGNYTFDG